MYIQTAGLIIQRHVESGSHIHLYEAIEIVLGEDTVKTQRASGHGS